MDTNFLFGISLTASFLAGVLALFAPCCITFLFPSYLGTIFKENKRVMYYTLVFALGLGLILVPKILTAAMSRQDIPLEQRKDFYLYVDEFQNYATEDFAVILSEARKYRLNLIVANQFVAQIEEDVKNAVFGNVGTMVTFRVGVPDANFLAHEFAPVFTEGDLTNIEKFHVYIKTIVGNEPVPPFSMDLTRDIEGEQKMMDPKRAELIRELSRVKYGRPKDIVEQETAVRAKL
jgi:hypothetical protein